MSIQKIFTVGNSSVVAIPKQLYKELGLKNGQKVVVEKIPDSNSILISPPKNNKKKTSDIEFKKWWNQFLEENTEILDGLA